MPVSPGIYVREFDFSEYVQRLGSTVLAIVGAASKGPIGKPIKVTNANDLVSQFGKPLLDEYGLQAGVQFLKEGDQLIFTRIANAAATASYPVPGTVGAIPAVKAAGTVVFVASTNPTDGDTVVIGDGALTRTFEFDNNSAFTGGRVPVLIGSTALDTLANLISAVSLSGLAVTARNTTVTVPQMTVTATVGGLVGNVAITETGTSITATGMTGGANAVAGTVATVMTAHAKSPGTWANGLRIVIKTPSVMFGAPAANFDMDIYVPAADGLDAQLVERFTNLSLDVASDRYVTNIMLFGKRGEVGPSGLIECDVANTAATISGSAGGVPYNLGDSPGVVGSNGVTGLTANHYIGSVVGQTATGLQSIRNPETVEFNVLAIPGVTDKLVIAAGLDLCKKRGDAIYVVDAPFGLDDVQVRDWHNGLSLIVPNSPTGPLDSSYGALYWSWIEVEDTYNSKTVWLPPSAGVTAAFAFNDRVAAPWFAPAGHKRGGIKCNRVEFSPSHDARETLQSDPHRVNPLVTFPTGTVIWGNRTLQRKLTALNNVHTRRMMLYIEKVCATAVQYLTFDPNDPVTWATFTATVTKELEPVKNGRGIEDFRVICDETTNPPEQRQRKTMRGQIMVKSVEAAEIIYMDFSLFATGAEFSTDY